MGKTTISWATDTLNPVRGCFPVTPGCAECYAMRLAATRLRHHPKYRGLATYDGRPRWTGEVQLDIDVMREVLTWRRPRRCFLCDMSDLFYEKVPDDFIAAVLGFCAAAPDHRFYILTKRASRMRRWFAGLQTDDDGPGHGHLGHRLLAIVSEAAAALRSDEDDHERAYDLLAERVPSNAWPLPNVWLGVSAEDQERADERIPELLATPAACRFVSYEPALGPIDCGDNFSRYREVGTSLLPAPDWLIAGDESGPRARPPAPLGWYRSVRGQCHAAGVAFFLKQFVRDRVKIELPKLDGRRHAEFPTPNP